MATKEDVPKVQVLIGPTFEALRMLGGSGNIQEINEKVAEVLKLPEEIQQVNFNDSADTWFGYRCRWARTYLKYLGYIDNSERGVWSITETGSHVSDEQLASVWTDVKRLEAERRRTSATSTEPDDEDPPEAEVEELTWKESLLSRLKLLDPSAFERLCQRLLRESGFSQVAVTGRSGDGGIDGVGVLRINLISFQTLFQCKRYKDAVSSGAVRDFRGAMIGRADKGLIITTGRFTADAQREATRDGAPAIELIDGEELCDLLKNLKLGVNTQVVEKVALNESFFDSL